MYVETKTLSTHLQAALKSLGYGRKDIKVIAEETTSLASSGGDGYRGFACLVNLDTGERKTLQGSWGGSNMFVKTVVDDSTQNIQLPAHGAVIQGHRGGTTPVWAQLHVSPEVLKGFLPPAPEAMSDQDQRGLKCVTDHKGGAYRHEELRRQRVQPSTIDSLVERGYLARNKAGALSATTKGRNARSTMARY